MRRQAIFAGSGVVVVWLCDCVVVWLCGCVVVWLCGCVVVWCDMGKMWDLGRQSLFR